MRRYLTPKRQADDAKTVRRVPIDGPVSVYRREGNSYAVVAETDDSVVDLGVRDATVSRKHSGEPPVELLPDDDGVRIRNRNSRNAITVRTGVGDRSLEQGESEVVAADCIIELGFATELRTAIEADRDSLSKAELEEFLGMQRRQDGTVMEGVSPAHHVRSVATNLRKASDDSVIECRKFATELKNFVAEHPVDDTDYDTVREELERITDRLESKSSGVLRGSGLDEEWREELNLVADRVEKLYGRAG